MYVHGDTVSRTTGQYLCLAYYKFRAYQMLIQIGSHPFVSKGSGR